jgi:hypothetical protein
VSEAISSKNRVFSDWNGLSDEIVNVSNPNISNNKLDAHFDDEANAIN